MREHELCAALGAERPTSFCCNWNSSNRIVCTDTMITAKTRKQVHLCIHRSDVIDHQAQSNSVCRGAAAIAKAPAGVTPPTR